MFYFTSVTKLHNQVLHLEMSQFGTGIEAFVRCFVSFFLPGHLLHLPGTKSARHLGRLTVCLHARIEFVPLHTAKQVPMT